MKKEDTDYSDGSVSQWNEGNFKNLRLHEAQELINTGKIDPFSLTEDRTKWNYQLWKAGIDILYGEGNSKYKQEEIDEIKKIKNIVELYMELKPPFSMRTDHSVAGKIDKHLPIIDNQKKIKALIEAYEDAVKKYNDLHGFSTRNMDEDDWRGL